MANKPDIGNKEFSKLIKDFPHQPNENIIKKINSKMFSLDLNKVYNYKPEYLAAEEFKRCLDLYEKRNPGQDPKKSITVIAGTQMLITNLEEPHKGKLEQLAIDTIKEIYQVPDYVNIKAIIESKLCFDAKQDDTPQPFLELSLEQKNNMRDEINKRIILNGLVHGSAMHIWKGMYHLIADKLDEINPALRELYDHYTSALGINLWFMSPKQFQQMIEDEVQITQGFNKLTFDKEQGFGGTITAKAFNFPVLLHEVNKGVMDWLISAGIPQHYSEEELIYYYTRADAYENEPWHYLLSPTLWIDLLECANVDNEKIPRIISKLTKLSYEEIVEIFRLTTDNKELAKKQIKGWQL